MIRCLFAGGSQQGLKILLVGRTEKKVVSMSVWCTDLINRRENINSSNQQAISFGYLGGRGVSGLNLISNAVANLLGCKIQILTRTSKKFSDSTEVKSLELFFEKGLRRCPFSPLPWDGK